MSIIAWIVPAWSQACSPICYPRQKITGPHLDCAIGIVGRWPRLGRHPRVPHHTLHGFSTCRPGSRHSRAAVLLLIFHLISERSSSSAGHRSRGCRHR